MPVGGKGNPDVVTSQPAAGAGNPGVVVYTPGGFATGFNVDTATVSRVAVGSGAAVTVLAANPSRVGYHVQSELANTDTVYLKEGAAASATDATADLSIGGAHEPLVNYRGVVTAIAKSGTQNLHVTEY
jgi:hypothetical protein